VPIVECVIRVQGGQCVLLDRFSGVEYARGTEAQLHQAAHGVYRITDAPRLGPVEFDPLGPTMSGYLQFQQFVVEAVVFQGRSFTPGVDWWIDGILFPDHLGIGFAERLADVPQFVSGVQRLTGQQVTEVRGGGSIAALGGPPLLGDWIKSGTFDPDRLVRRFERELGGVWALTFRERNPGSPDDGYLVTIHRQSGT